MREQTWDDGSLEPSLKIRVRGKTGGPTAPCQIQALGAVATLAEAEKLKAIVETILPLSDATRGQELSERGHTRGKIVLRVVNAG